MKWFTFWFLTKGSHAKWIKRVGRVTWTTQQHTVAGTHRYTNCFDAVLCVQLQPPLVHILSKIAVHSWQWSSSSCTDLSLWDSAGYFQLTNKVANASRLDVFACRNYVPQVWVPFCVLEPVCPFLTLTPEIHRALCPTTLSLTGYSLFFKSILRQPWKSLGYCENTSRSAAGCETLWRLAPPSGTSSCVRLFVFSHRITVI